MGSKLRKDEEHIIYINDNFRYIIHTDGNLQLQKRVEYKKASKTGKIENFIFVGWFGNLERLTKRVIDENAVYNLVASSSDEDRIMYKDVLKFYEDSHKEIMEFFKGKK